MQKINALSKSKNNDAGSKYSTSTVQVIFRIAGMGLIALNPVNGGLFLLSAFSYVRHEKIQSASIRVANFFRASFNQLVSNSEVNDAKENNVKVSAKL